MDRPCQSWHLWGWRIFLSLTFPVSFIPSLEFPATTAAASSSHSPLLLVPTIPLPAAVQAAAPPADYHSESAESMDEIPVAQTHLGSTALHSSHKNSSSNARRCPVSTPDPKHCKGKSLYSGHKVKRKSCQQDRRMERDLELFSKTPAVFVSKSSGEPHVSQPRPGGSTSEPQHRKCTSKRHLGSHDPCLKDIRTNTTVPEWPSFQSHSLWGWSKMFFFYLSVSVQRFPLQQLTLWWQQHCCVWCCPTSSTLSWEATKALLHHVLMAAAFWARTALSPLPLSSLRGTGFPDREVPRTARVGALTRCQRELN